VCDALDIKNLFNYMDWAKAMMAIKTFGFSSSAQVMQCHFK